ncbi:hypothetical protein B0H14DRAFT_2646438 [Mycena olivaceomarginata]|nr:hypothetical protein B0H14DRAFT_2646438 [Mycena olivaceomarginata]
MAHTCTLWSPHITIEKAQLEEVEAKLKPSKNLNSMIHGISGWKWFNSLFGIGEEQKDMGSCWLNLRLPNAGFDGASIPNHQSVEQLPYLGVHPGRRALWALALLFFKPFEPSGKLNGNENG